MQGIIAFSYMAWAEFSLPTGDNYLAERMEVYLTASGQNDMPLVYLYMKDAQGLRYKQWENTSELPPMRLRYASELPPISP